ncbi:MAG: ketoacyl-ACP synthase III [Francisellaceae bacterium]|jgi:3-oxoacyl-[acyl-carrier-protein] synthase III|nr:ketoacyl-ACP synthase III [Francisellaceae bacterium]MBT6208380.1 ketoacyl-ACP synthase III [Francisellaceae bacterium]MBT6538173.1 ketoacyl-ACP synthase III [Francisellaceae bacterium]
MHHVRMAGVGSCLPKKVLTNHDLAKKIDTSDEWIKKRTGITQRYVVSENESVVSMGAKAAKSAMDMANVKPEEIDQIIVATCSAKDIFPSAACKIQTILGIPPCPAYDLQAACAGFVYAMSCAENAIKVGMAKKILVIGSEAMSKVMDWQDRTTCVLFGDGAGAVVLESADEPGILATELSADGKFSEALLLPNQTVSGNKYLSMQGKTIFKVAVEELGNIAQRVIASANISAEEIDWIVPHQANLRIIASMAKKIGVSMDKVILTVSEHANTSTASIPLALDYAIKNGTIKRGDTLLLDAFGGGLAWGAIVLKF